MAGKFGRLTEASPFARYWNSSFFASIAFALAQNRLTLLDSSPEFQRLVKTMQCKNFSPKSRLTEDHENIIRFALKKAAKMAHHSPIEYNIVPSMREELGFFEEFLAPDSGGASIAYLIKRTPFATTFGDACLHSAGGYSINLEFVWWLKFPDSVMKRILLHLKDNRDRISYQSTRSGT